MSRPIQKQMVRDEIAYLEMRQTGSPSSAIALRGLANSAPVNAIGSSLPSWAIPVWYGVAALSSGVSAYHGYKRNKSVGWAVVWGMFGAIAPVITPAVAVAEGFGKPAKKGR